MEVQSIQSNIAEVYTPVPTANEQETSNSNNENQSDKETPDQTPDQTPKSEASNSTFNNTSADNNEQEQSQQQQEKKASTKDVKIEMNHETGNDDTILSVNEEKFVKNVLKCCSEMCDVDAYQVMAFDNNTRETWKDNVKYIFDILKCILCALSQVCGIIIIMYEVIQFGLEEKSWCNIPPAGSRTLAIFFDSNLKILAFLFSSFLAYFSIDRLTEVEKKGMYYKMKYANKIKWVNTMWLRIGFTVNLFVSIIAVYGSFLVVFFGDNSLDMVLNSVALFFIIELDDLLVKHSDYKRIASHIEAYNNRDEMVKKMISKELHCCKSCFYVCCGKFGQFIGWFVAAPFRIIQYVTIAFCLICPGLIVICY